MGYSVLQVILVLVLVYQLCTVVSYQYKCCFTANYHHNYNSNRQSYGESAKLLLHYHSDDLYSAGSTKWQLYSSNLHRDGLPRTTNITISETIPVVTTQRLRQWRNVRKELLATSISSGSGYFIADFLLQLFRRKDVRPFYLYAFYQLMPRIQLLF